MNEETKGHRFLTWLAISIIITILALWVITGRPLQYIGLILALTPLAALSLRAILSFKTSFAHSAVAAIITLAIIGRLDLALSIMLVALVLAVGLHSLQRYWRSKASQLIGQHAPVVRVLRLNREVRVAYNKVVPKDRVVVRAGEQVPVDGIMLSHEASIRLASDQTILERLSKGDSVTSGDIAESELTIEATNVGQSATWVHLATIKRSMFKKMPMRVQRIEQILTIVQLAWIFGSFAAGFLIQDTQIVVWLIILGIWWLAGLANRTSALSLLFKSIKRGLLIKSWSVIDKVAKAKVAVLDKTGTITTGLPLLVDIKVNAGYTREDALRVAAALEFTTDHPIARSIKHAAEKINIPLPKVDTMKSVTSRGIVGEIEKEVFAIGNVKLLQSMGLEIPMKMRELEKKQAEQGATIIYLANSSTVIALLILKAIARPSASQLVAAFKRRKIESHLITGDTEFVVRSIGASIGIDKDSLFAFLSPQQKAEHVKTLRPNFVLTVADPETDKGLLGDSDLAIGFMGNGPALGDKSTDVIIRSPDLMLVDRLISWSNRTRALWWLSPIIVALLSVGGSTFLLSL